MFKIHTTGMKGIPTHTADPTAPLFLLACYNHCQSCFFLIYILRSQFFQAVFLGLPWHEGSKLFKKYLTDHHSTWRHIPYGCNLETVLSNCYRTSVLHGLICLPIQILLPTQILSVAPCQAQKIGTAECQSIRAKLQPYRNGSGFYKLTWSRELCMLYYTLCGALHIFHNWNTEYVILL